MDEIATGEADLVVTSPPYWNAIDYETHVADPALWYRTRKQVPYEDYLDWLSGCFKEVYRVVKDGGFVCVVIGTVLYNGKHYPLPFHFVSLMECLGFMFHQDIIWHKMTGGARRAGVTIQHPYPGYYYPNIMTEYILVFQKSGDKIFKERSDNDLEKSRIAIDDVFAKEIANNVWHIAPVPPNYLPHPCPFPEEIPYRLITLYSYINDLVLDPFMGIGTTAKAALALGRNFVGYEIQQKYIDVAKERINEPLHLRQPIVARFEKIKEQA